MLNYNELYYIYNLIFVIITFVIYYYHISMLRRSSTFETKIIYGFQTTIFYVSKLDIVYLILL